MIILDRRMFVILPVRSAGRRMATRPHTTTCSVNSLAMPLRCAQTDRLPWS